MEKVAKSRDPSLRVFFTWLFRQPVIVRIIVVGVSLLLPVLVIKMFIENDVLFFYLADITHIWGLLVLGYKLTVHKSCSGLSLKTQELTAIYLSSRLFVSANRNFNLHAVLTLATLISTLWVIYMMRFKVNSTYIEELDNAPRYFVLVPCAVLAILIHPAAFRFTVLGLCWAFTIYLEAVAVLPQLRMMQNAQVVETFTAHYVFALGVARLFNSVMFVQQLIRSRGALLFSFGVGKLWVSTSVIGEIVQTIILADFCYYYVKSAIQGDAVVRLPSNV